VPEQLVRSLDLVTVQKQQFVDGNRVRRLSELVELSRSSDGEITTHTLFSWNPGDDSFEFHGQSRIRERIKRSRGWNDTEFDKQLDERRRLLEYLLERDPDQLRGDNDCVPCFRATSQSGDRRSRRRDVPAG